MTQIRLKKKVGQIYINIPGFGTMSMEAGEDRPDNMNELLRNVHKYFWKQYKKEKNAEPRP